jgi:hypothetical protein
VDVYLPGSGGAQIHDLNPTQFPPVGLFWTLQIPANSVQVDLTDGTASYRAAHLPILDYGNLANALFAGGPNPIPGSVSFKVAWSGATQSIDINNRDPVFGGFSGTFIRNSAQMEWTAKVGDFEFVSEPLRTSTSSFAEIGQETNGSFLQTG